MVITSTLIISTLITSTLITRSIAVATEVLPQVARAANSQITDSQTLLLFLEVDMIFRTDIQVRFNDTDAQGHLNNTSMALYVEQARVDFFAALEQPTRTLILANLSLDFRKQVHFGDVVHVETTVMRVGNTSVSLKQDVFANGERATETTSVIVIFDYASARPTPVAADLRQKLHAYLAARDLA